MSIKLTPIVFNAKYTTAQLKKLAPSSTFSHLKKPFKQLQDVLARFENVIGQYQVGMVQYANFGIGALDGIKKTAEDLIIAAKAVSKDKSKEKAKYADLMTFCTGLVSALPACLKEVDKQYLLVKGVLEGKEDEEELALQSAKAIKEKIQSREAYYQKATTYLKAYQNFFAKYSEITKPSKASAQIYATVKNELNVLQKAYGDYSISTTALASRTNATYDENLITPVITKLLKQNETIQLAIADLAKEIKIQGSKCESVLDQLESHSDQMDINEQDAATAALVRVRLIKKSSETLKNSISLIGDFQHNIENPIKNRLKELQGMDPSAPAYEGVLGMSVISIKELEMKLSQLETAIEKLNSLKPILQSAYQQATKANDKDQTKEIETLTKQIAGHEGTITKYAKMVDQFKRLVTQRAKIQAKVSEGNTK